ncbi:DUF5000 domain-containing lipoprotein [Flavobacterium acetivorans]|uniref:DUF5000 domain-containing lipoprotein n=1 Tax=Flavobacterium acetivorans TaxID=2893883 RepID=UPI001E2DB146|nr:DUF5000 domain-containing lipoprotein [Flavobacterium sp. F-29]UFH34321.1 DUF4959 domain-containing protein [Flavobacterium sp. F-29]
MKYFKLIIALTLFVFVACSEFEHGPTDSSSGNPAKVENVVITPINGGLEITYDLPKDKNVLYVKAVYMNSKGVESEVKTSVFNNKIQILGFKDVAEVSVKLYSVNRAETNSEAVVVSGTPLISPVDMIQQNFEITTDFGGAKFKWNNALKTPIAIQLFAPNEKGKLELVNTQYTEQIASSFSLRGYPSVPTKFAAVIRDRYDNFSDTIYAGTADKMLVPLHEERLDKTIFKKVVLQNDDNWDAWEGDYWGLFDDKNGTIVHTQGNIPRPSILTVDLGVVVNLSRINVLQRADGLGLGFAYTHGNPKKYAVYGSKELPGPDGNLANWIKLRDCESIKPSGLPIGQKTDEDVAHFWAGDEYTFENAPEIRYFRFVVYDTWDGAGYISFSELTFWGNIVK